MASSRIPGPLCIDTALASDQGTLGRWCSPAPGPLCSVPPPPAPRQWHHYSRSGGFVASTLTLSPEAVTLLQVIETLRLQPYDDQTGKATSAWVKGATIGYGHLIDSADWKTYKDGIDEAQADTLFLADVAPFERTVGETVTAGLQQYEFDALVILAFNIGKAGFRNSSVATLVNDPAAATGYASLELAWKAWNKSQGQVMLGLDRRRAAEWRIYTSAIYARW